MTPEREAEIRLHANPSQWGYLADNYGKMMIDLLAEVTRLRALCNRAAETMKVELRELDANDEWTGEYYHEELINELNAAGGE